MRGARLLLLVTVVVAAACERDGGGLDPSVLTAAAEKTLSEGSARLVATMEGTESEGGEQAFRMDGVYDFKANRGEFHVDLGGAGASTRATAVAVDGVVYLNVGEGVVPGKTWVKIDANAMGQGAAGAAAQTFQANPATSLQYLAGAEAVERRGQATVRQVETTRYRLRVDVAKAARSQPAAVRRQLERLGNVEFPADAWVDRAGRLRRFSYTIDIAKLSGGNASGPLGSSVKVTHELFDFGAPTSAEAPPADQVADVAELSPDS